MPRQSGQIGFQFGAWYKNLLLVIEKKRDDGGVEPVERAEDGAEGQIIEIGEIDPMRWSGRGDKLGRHAEVEEKIDTKNVIGIGRELAQRRPSAHLPPRNDLRVILRRDREHRER